MFIQEFLTYIRCELNLSVHTVSSYRIDLEQWRDWATDNGSRTFEPNDVTASDLRAWLAHIAGENLSPRSIRRKVQSLRAFFKFMMLRHGLTANPAAELSLARTPKPLPVYIPETETNSMLDSDFNSDDFTETRNRLIMTMLYSTGMRQDELLTLTDCNVDTRKGELKVHGKRNKERVIPFGQELAAMIETYRKLRKRDVDFLSDRFFVKENGEPVYAKLIYNVVHRTLSEAGVHASRLSPHVMRHSFATDMLNSGAELSAVQQLLGHQSLATTQVYTHITYRELKQNYELAHPRASKRKGG